MSYIQQCLLGVSPSQMVSSVVAVALSSPGLLDGVGTSLIDHLDSTGLGVWPRFADVPERRRCPHFPQLVLEGEGVALRQLAQDLSCS
jgi:hypothetical protein